MSCHIGIDGNINMIEVRQGSESRDLNRPKVYIDHSISRVLPESALLLSSEPDNFDKVHVTGDQHEIQSDNTVAGSKCSTTKDQPVALYIDVAAKYHIKAEYLYIRNSQNKKRESRERERGNVIA
ncbi:hypothetical protein PILCRDRAFT_337654 [Piloderma croceum F 1598]|uniref:Uncharacterized protein n=1 Tax=Piloderma croceum (strain F 1598) TaxID=765440 RepID=A0A0C3G4I0_PILCF|nr:hypothetical protein PILCRDRAFT_337654 [Piloderma croceum F 1598]